VPSWDRVCIRNSVRCVIKPSGIFTRGDKSRPDAFVSIIINVNSAASTSWLDQSDCHCYVSRCSSSRVKWLKHTCCIWPFRRQTTDMRYTPFTDTLALKRFPSVSEMTLELLPVAVTWVRIYRRSSMCRSG